MFDVVRAVVDARRGAEGDGLVDRDHVDPELERALDDRDRVVRVVEQHRQGLAAVVAGRVELDPVDPVLAHLALEIGDRPVALERVDRPVEEHPVRVALLQLEALVDRDQAVVEVVVERRAVVRDHVHHGLLEEDLLELIGLPVARPLLHRRPVLVVRREQVMEAVAPGREALGELVGPVLRLPVVGVADRVDDDRLIDHLVPPRVGGRERRTLTSLASAGRSGRS